MTIANARDSLGKVIEIIGIGDEDLKNFVENRERLLQISFNKMSRSDQDLIMAVKHKLRNHLLEIENFLDEPNIFTDSEDSLSSFLAEVCSLISMRKVNGYVAIYIWKFQELKTEINKHSGMSRSTREFLKQVKSELQTYRKDINNSPYAEG